MPIRQAVIFCGGRGERLRPLTDHLPKPMAEVNGRPFLWHLLNQLAEKATPRFLLLTGYFGQKVRDYFGDGSKWGWTIQYNQGPVEWDTGRRLWEARDLLEEDFLLAYSDNFVQLRPDWLLARLAEDPSSLSLHLAPKKKGNIRLGPGDKIECYDPSRTEPDLGYVEVGYMMVKKTEVLQVLTSIPRFPDVSFSMVLQEFARLGRLAGLVIKDPYHSIGDLQRLELARQYLKPHKILLIDRDGTINLKAPQGEYVTSWAGFEWLPGSREGLVELSRAGFRFIVITNQAGVARGMVDPEELRKIHENMVSELALDGVTILQVYTCTDHWETNSYRRKPNPGMFYEATSDFGFRLDRSLYVGDDLRDCLAAKNAGCDSVLIGPERHKLRSSAASPRASADTLLEAVPVILQAYLEWEEQP
jgi:D-glycero-D-manno-heptose 1,7-bisphosphate phosphatase